MNTGLDHIRAELATHRAAMDRTVAGYVAWTRERARTPAHQEDEPDQGHHDDHEESDDYDMVDSWMADPRGGATPRAATRSGPHDDVLARLDNGELTWDDVLSGRATDPDSVAVRTFLTDRIADYRRVREART